jgi:acyl-CoA thioesterase-1
MDVLEFDLRAHISTVFPQRCRAVCWRGASSPDVEPYVSAQPTDERFRFSRRVVMAGLGSVLALAGVNRAGAQARPVRLVALGDSLTAGYGLPASAAFPAQLQVALTARGRTVEIENAGVSGDTAQGGLDRLDWSVGDGTHGVILELGANDALRGLDPSQTRAALEGIITRLKARGIPVLLAGMRAPPNMGPEFQARFDAIFPDLARAHDLVFYPFFLDGVAGERRLNLSDGIHPTAEGIGVIVARMLPTVERFLDSLSARS